MLIVSDHGFEASKSRPHLTGGHETRAAVHGVIFARGRGIPGSDSAGKVSVNDIAPSLLAWLGLPVARNMPGQPAPFLGISSPRMIASYDGIEVKRVEVRTPGHEEEILEQLRTLGYLEDDQPAAPEEDRPQE